MQFSDFTKKNIGVLRAYAKTGKVDAQFIEMMACEGGCVTGPSAHNDPVAGKRQLPVEPRLAETYLEVRKQ